MKKKILLFLLLTVIVLPFSNVNAEELSINIENVNTDNEILIQNKINEFLTKKNKDTVNELTISEEKELVDIIGEYKKTLYPSIQPASARAVDFANSYNIAGYVFATLDAKTSGWNHGHAGIGHSAGGNVIEANPGDGVKLYTNRVNKYWSKCDDGGIYSIKNASSSDYNKAKNYANDRIGRDYGFNPIDGDFYCSELVYYAWDAAGYNIASSRIWGTPILPSQIMNDGDTVLEASFPF